MVKEIKRNYYLNLFSSSAEKILNSDGTKNVQFKWNIRDLQLGSVADIALVQIIHTNAVNNTAASHSCGGPRTAHSTCLRRIRPT